MFSSPQVIVLKAFLGRGQAHFIVSADPFEVQNAWAKGHLDITGLLLQLQPKRPERGWRQQGWRSPPPGKDHIHKNHSKMGRESLCRFESFTHLGLKWDWPHGLTLEPFIHTRAVHAGKNPPPNGKEKMFPSQNDCDNSAVSFLPSASKAFLAFLPQHTTLAALHVQHHSNSSLASLQIILVLIKLVNAITIWSKLIERIYFGPDSFMHVWLSIRRFVFDFA